MHERKKKLRAQAVERRDAVPHEVREAKDRLILERVTQMPEYADARTVLLFASFRTEVNTGPIIRDALKKNKRVVLPRVDKKQKRLRTFRIQVEEELKPGFHGIPEPEVGDEREVSPGEIDLILIPGVAFDVHGGRLGYGGGYYDRFIAELSNHPPLIAIAYEEQIIERVPVTEHDVRVQKIVTDKRIIKVNATET